MHIYTACTRPLEARQEFQASLPWLSEINIPEINFQKLLLINIITTITHCEDGKA